MLWEFFLPRFRWVGATSIGWRSSPFKRVNAAGSTDDGGYDGPGGYDVDVLP